MDDPYTKYVENFKLGFDSIPEIEENLNLQQTLNVVIIIFCMLFIKLQKLTYYFFIIRIYQLKRINLFPWIIFSICH
jgi:hypothetical protein